MKRRFFFLWCNLTMLFVCFHMASAAEIERIQAKGELVVSLNYGYPPFSMEKDGKPIGLDVDLAHLLADYLGVKVRFIRPQKYEEQIPKLLALESDIIIAAMTRTVARALLVNFTDPYFEVSQAALVQRSLVDSSAHAYFDLTAVKNIRVGVKKNTTHEIFARQLFPSGAIHTYATSEEAATAFVQGEVDAVTADSPFIQAWRATHPKLHHQVKALLTPVTKEYYGFAIRKGDVEFLNWLNLFIDQIRSDGTLDLLVHEYFVQMSWARETTPASTMTPALMLQNAFVKKRKEALDAQRKAAASRQGGSYE